jgi:cytochrome c553
MFNRRFAIACVAAPTVIAVSVIAVSITALASITAPARADDDAVAMKALACAICHGQTGPPISANFPIIWGQQGNYLYKELHDFHSGDRKNPLMAPLVQGTSLDDLRALANYFAAKPWPGKQTASTTTTTPSPAPPPEVIAAKIQMCKACHQANFEGGAPAPRLAGLSYEYLRGAMNAFADGQRTNNLDMPGFMKALSPGDRDAMAKYLAGL